jgi:hypothetical protein
MGGALDKTLQGLLFNGAADARRVATGLLGEDQSAWFTYDPSGRGPKRFDRVMKEQFDPSGIVGAFGAASGGEMTSAEAAMLQTEFGLVEQMARDFGLRRRTRLQAHAHGIVRARAMAHESGTLTGPLLERLKDMLTAGDEE